MILARAHRIEANAAEAIDREHRIEIAESLRYHAARPREITARLAELDGEWDIERAIETIAAVAALIGLVLALVDRAFLLLPLAVAAQLLRHAMQGRSLPMPLLRKLGLRTSAEICEERCGLRMLADEYRSLADPAPIGVLAQAEEFDKAVEA